MDRSVLLTLLKELAASTDGVHAEVGIGGVHPNDETFLQLTSLANRDEYAIVSVGTGGWFQLDVSGGFYHAQADDLASDETVREYVEQYFQAALAYLAGDWSTRTSRLFRLPIVVVDGAVDLFGQPLALGLRVRDSWRMLSRRPPRASFSDEHSMIAPVTDEDRANFPIPLLPTVGICRAGEYQGLYLFSNLLNLFPVAERMWDIVIAGGGPGGDDELFFAEDGLGVATVRDLDIEWAPAHLQNVARRELFHGLRIDVPIQHPSGWESDGDQPHIASRVAADGPWARFEQPA
ncbi:hypothetical protein I6E68_11140 [Salinibacterium sp. NSLL150]|uniref:hypothetical protein n=1 Tax=unclassified Salinibacterium TaxID=2632331 RepID=UPI0018CF1A6A|nr:MULTISPECIES: hypothetical protein [unclassified Salinibacterium]MBH0099690.1 hypothetical protein [Salinibacterium sp. NSLL35]MBH0102444.1 hypothetical protein [Salinibacterium sp. NSLL150]MBH0105204.1 hypothetical protein [Salinibacterium sp. NSLL16]MBH0107964.1 hypothetical protein [Salinibacterium sp. NSLL17]